MIEGGWAFVYVIIGATTAGIINAPIKGDTIEGFLTTP